MGHLYYCSSCNEHFETYTLLQKHLASLIPDLTLECVACSEDFDSQQALDEHLNRSPAHMYVFACEDCGYPTAEQRAMDQREKEAYDNAGVTEVIEAGGEADVVLLGAVYPQHLMIYGCGECDSQFNTQRGMVQHIEDSITHEGFQCSRCKRDFTSRILVGHRMNLTRS